jgi:hypothetical protein
MSKFEGGLDNAFDRAAGAVFRGSLEPAQIAKRAEKQMQREKLVGAGKQYAPTLYTVLVNAGDNRKLYNFYPTMSAEIETYLVSKGTQSGLKFDTRPLVRFIVDNELKSGKFEVIAENVAAPIIAQLRDEEAEFYGLKPRPELDRVAEPHVLEEQLPPQPALDRGPAVMGTARLSNLSAGLSFALTLPTMIIGRDSKCDIAIDDANISRHHAQISQDVVGTWKLVDLSSTNGTQLNGNFITSALLRDGDQITVGVTQLEFRER